MAGRQATYPPAVVVLPAEIDMINREQVYDQLYAAFVSGAAVVIADFTNTTFCDCGSLRRMLTIQHRVAGQGVQLRLAIPCGSPVRQVADLLGLSGQPLIYPGTGEAAREYR